MSMLAIPVVEQLRRTVRLRGLSECTPEDRAAERHRRAALTGVAAALSKTVGVATSLVTVPLTLTYLGTERFGLWMTISSTIAVLGFADFGFGNGLMNAVSRAHGKDDEASVARFVSSGVALLTVVASALCAAFVAMYAVIPWARIFNVRSAGAVAEAAPAMAVFFACFAVCLPLGVVQRLQLGLQEGFRSSLWQLVGSVAGLGGVLLVIHLRGGLPWLVLALAGTPALAMLLNAGFYFLRVRPALRPRAQLIEVAAMAVIARTGILFFVLQLAVALAYSADNLVIAQALGAEAVAHYSVTARLFSMVSVVLAMFLGPLWPAYGEAISRGDLGWVRRTLGRSMLIAVAVAFTAATILTLFAPTLLRVWLHRSIEVPTILLIGLAAWTVLDAAGVSLAMFLNGANVVKMQVILASIFSVSCLLLKIVFIRRFGIAGVPWATVISYLFLSALPCALLVPRILRRMTPAE